MTAATALIEELPRDRPAPGLLGWAERGLVPDWLLRQGMRRLCAQRLREERAGGLGEQGERLRERVGQLRLSPLAIHTDTANAQHYELPPAFFQHCLGSRLKYSCAYYPAGDRDTRPGRGGDAGAVLRAALNWPMARTSWSWAADGVR